MMQRNPPPMPPPMQSYMSGPPAWACCVFIGLCAVGLVIVPVLVVALILLLVFGAVGHAAPPPDADMSLAPWFQGLRQPGTDYSCCSIADCRPVVARVLAGHYQVWHNGAWLDVPDEAILSRRENPVGETVACINSGRVLCLVRGAEM